VSTKKNVFQFFALWQHEKEETWLNQMAAEGWNLVSTTGLTYQFEHSDTEAFTYRLEYLKESPRNMVNKPYFEFLAESGIEVVDSFRNWDYLRKPAELGPFDLYSDLDSRIEHYERIKKGYMSILGIVGVVLAINLWDYLITGELPVSAFLIVLIGVLGWGYRSLSTTLANLRKKRQLSE